jgi:hypothetical protein
VRAPRRLDSASLLAALGGLLLFVSLFLDWYQPGLSAWTAFEVLDLVLAALGIAAIGVGVRSVLGEDRPRDGALPLLGAAAFLIVGSQLVNHPPAAQGGGVQGGAWLGLAGTALMAVGGALNAAGVSLTVSLSPRAAEASSPRAARGGEAQPPPLRRREPSPATEAAAVEPEVQDELYPEQERNGPIGADDPEPWTASPEDETLSFDPESEASG